MPQSGGLIFLPRHPVQDYTKLEVWRRAHRLTLGIYRVSRVLPPDEAYGLRAQLRRSALTIGSSIAEGCGRSTRRDFARFLDIAAGSANELEYQLRVALDLGYLEHDAADPLRSEVSTVRRMLSGLIRRLRAAEAQTGPQPTEKGQATSSPTPYSNPTGSHR